MAAACSIPVLPRLPGLPLASHHSFTPCSLWSQFLPLQVKTHKLRSRLIQRRSAVTLQKGTQRRLALALQKETLCLNRQKRNHLKAARLIWVNGEAQCFNAAGALNDGSVSTLDSPAMCTGVNGEAQCSNAASGLNVGSVSTSDLSSMFTDLVCSDNGPSLVYEDAPIAKQDVSTPKSLVLMRVKVCPICLESPVGPLSP